MKEIVSEIQDVDIKFAMRYSTRSTANGKCREIFTFPVIFLIILLTHIIDNFNQKIST
jgi:hypothetical protein